MPTKTLVVAGGGAAGFFCAVNAARLSPGLRVVILEKSGKLLSKVKVSGGGRCNVTHQCHSITEMIKCYPRGASFLKKSFHHFFTSDVIEWFKSRGVKLKAEPDGRMFPVSNSSQTIIDCLLAESEKYAVELRMHTALKSIKKAAGRWVLHTTGETLIADAVCIAAGGFPKPDQFSWLLETGHTISMPVPSLFTFNLADKAITGLMGIAVENVQVKIAGTKLVENGSLLITHWGFSGHAILRLSAWGARLLAEKEYAFEVLVNWCPPYNETSVIPLLLNMQDIHSSRKVINKNEFGLPARLWEHLIIESGIDEDCKWGNLSAKLRNRLARTLCSSVFRVNGKATFKEEFVTAGGISLGEIDANSMESKLAPGLYFAGEIMDVDGITGGYNFQHAWTSGYLAAQSISKKHL